MSIRNILVAYNGTETADRALKLAAHMSRRVDAHLTGLFAHSMPQSYVQMEAYMTEAALDILERNEREAENRVSAKFAELIAAEEQGLRTTFLCERGFPNEIISQFARTYDLTVVGQPDQDRHSIYTDADPDTIALESGRPVLIAPRGFEMLEFSRGAVVAWDGKRAAARALSDAMDLLETEDSITVLHVGREDDVRLPGRDIMEHLSRHGMSASLNCQPKGGLAISDIVLNTCADSGAGLLVMGAYEHSRFSEMLLGGVTRDIVSRTHIPVLMSH
ncbi:MAG: universal stress protein [Pseudomonadota bacterium]